MTLFTALVVFFSSPASAQNCDDVQDAVVSCDTVYSIDQRSSDGEANVNTGCVGNDVGADYVAFFDPPNGQEVILSWDPANFAGQDPESSLIVIEGGWCGLTASCLDTSTIPNAGGNAAPANQTVSFTSDGGGYYIVVDSEGSRTLGDLQVGCPSQTCPNSWVCLLYTSDAADE